MYAGKLAGNLVADANWLHLSSSAIAFSSLLFSNLASAQPGEEAGMAHTTGSLDTLPGLYGRGWGGTDGDVTPGLLPWERWDQA